MCQTEDAGELSTALCTANSVCCVAPYRSAAEHTNDLLLYHLAESTSTVGGTMRPILGRSDL
jgi:hypothetical protein